MARGKRQEKDILENVNTPTIDESVSDYTFSKNNPNIYFNDITYKGIIHKIPTINLSEQEASIVLQYAEIREKIYNAKYDEEIEIRDKGYQLELERTKINNELIKNPNDIDLLNQKNKIDIEWNKHLQNVLSLIYKKEKHLILELIDKKIFYEYIVISDKINKHIMEYLDKIDLDYLIDENDNIDEETKLLSNIVYNSEYYKDEFFRKNDIEKQQYNELWTSIIEYKKISLEDLENNSSAIDTKRFYALKRYDFTDDEIIKVLNYYDETIINLKEKDTTIIDPLKSNEITILSKIQEITNYTRPNELVVSKNQAYNGLYYGNEEKIKNYIDKLEENNIDELIVADINKLVMETKNHSKDNEISFYFDKNFKGLNTNDEKIINYALTLVHRYNDKGIPAIIFPSDFKKDYRGDYSNDKDSNKITKEEKEQLDKELEYLSNIKVWVDYSKPINSYNDNLKKGKKEKDYILMRQQPLLKIDKIKVGQKNRLREGYLITETPPFYTMLMQLEQYTTIPKWVYSILNTNKTNDIILKYFIDKITSLSRFSNWGIDKANNNKLYDITPKQQDYAGYDPNFFKIYQIQDGINEYEDRASWDKECREYGFSITLNIDTFIEENKLLDDTKAKTRARLNILNNILLFLTAVSNKYIANNVIEKPLIDDFDIIDSKGNILNKPNFSIDKYNKLKLLDENTIKKYENLKSIKLKITNIDK